MSAIKTLPIHKLRANLDPQRIPHETSDTIKKNGHRSPPQPRALHALELALHIKDMGYNIFLVGEEGLGRSYMLRDFLTPKARRLPTPPDLVYAHNFAAPDAPILLNFPAGQGKKFKTELSQSLQKIRKEIVSRLDTDSFTRALSSLRGTFQGKREKLYQKMDVAAESKGFNLDMDEQGSLTLYPLAQGKRLNEQEFENLDSKERKALKVKGDSLIQGMADLMRKLSQVEQDWLESERKLEKNVISSVLESYLLQGIHKKYKKICNDTEDLQTYIQQLHDDIIENTELFLQADAAVQGQSQHARRNHYPSDAAKTLSQGHDQHAEDCSSHYEINLFVDNSELTGAPIIVDDHPTYAHLLGCIEREAEMGTLITDLTLIKAGTLHKANGGFLVIHLINIMQYPQAWEGLLRALRSRLAKIEEAGEGENARTKGITPEPVPLNLKVILIGTEEMYEGILLGDERFSRLFKVKAHLTTEMPRWTKNIDGYLLSLRRIIDESSLLPFDRNALAGLVDYGSQLCEDQKKLSLKFPLIRDVMIEASALASMGNKKIVDAQALKQAQEARQFRTNLVEEAFMEEYDRKVIKVATSGTAVGKVNGLSVTWYGDFEFGLPHQISAVVGVGHGGIIDLEREAELSGPIHTKAMLILKSYLVSQFARTKPLVLTGSLCFEQSYAGIEGDSASGAELAALLSAISGVPNRLDLAFTGAVSLSGEIMAVGGVTRKVEGFFEVCRRHGLTGQQGVILPRDNIDNLMLNDAVISAVEKKQFHIYPVGHITEAMALLTGMPAGRSNKNATFTKGSLYDKVNTKLEELGRLAKSKTSRK